MAYLYLSGALALLAGTLMLTSWAMGKAIDHFRTKRREAKEAQRLREAYDKVEWELRAFELKPRSQQTREEFDAYSANMARRDRLRSLMAV